MGWRRLLTIALIGALAGCGGDGGSPDERDEILRAVDAARDAFVAGRPEKACALLTPHGRERAKNFGRAYEDTASCEAALRYELEVDRDPRVDSRVREDLAATRFEVVKTDGSEALVSATLGQIEPVMIGLERTDDGWRIHDSDAVPEGD